MDGFLNAKLDSDDDDDDYVPQKNEASDESEAKPDIDEDELTGIAGLKAQKRKKEIDDLWAIMQEDDYYSKKKSNTTQQPVNKALKTSENQRVPVSTTKIETPVKKEVEKPKDETFNAALEAIRLMKKK